MTEARVGLGGLAARVGLGGIASLSSQAGACNSTVSPPGATEPPTILLTRYSEVRPQYRYAPSQG